jgi:hypothetical protein
MTVFDDSSRATGFSSVALDADFALPCDGAVVVPARDGGDAGVALGGDAKLAGALAVEGEAV